MDENLRETTELPESGETAPNEENEPETKSIRFVPSAYDPRGIEQWLSERAAEGKLLLRYDDFVIGEPRDCRYHLEPAADDDEAVFIGRQVHVALPLGNVDTVHFHIPPALNFAGAFFHAPPLRYSAACFHVPPVLKYSTSPTGSGTARVTGLFAVVGLCPLVIPAVTVAPVYVDGSV